MNTTIEAIRASDSMPSPKGVALEVLRLADSDESSIPVIAGVIESDPALSGRLLGMANSPLIGTSRPIVSIRQATALLGIRAVKLLALGFSLLSNKPEQRCRRFDYDAFWSSSLARAVAARQFATRMKCFSSEEIFTCGLLSRIGQLALATVFPETYDEVLSEGMEAPIEDLLRIEEEALGMSHAAVSAELLADWCVPGLFCEAIAAQYDPVDIDPATADRANTLAAVLNAAGTLSEVLSSNRVHGDALSRMTRSAKRLDIAPDVLHLLYESISEEWQQAGIVYEINTPRASSLSEIYAMAAERRKTLSESPTAVEMEN